MAVVVVRVEAHVGRIMRLSRPAHMTGNSRPSDLEPIAYPFVVPRPAVCDNQLVRGVVFEQHCRTAVAECLFDIADDLLQKDIEIERRADSLGDALKQQEFLNLLVHAAVAIRMRVDLSSLEHMYLVVRRPADRNDGSRGKLAASCSAPTSQTGTVDFAVSS